MDIMMGILSTLFKIDEQVNNRNRNFTVADYITVMEDVDYSPREKMDIYVNEKIEENRPVVINIHGGGWMVGDKKWRKGIANIYAEHGFFTINPNYSLSPATEYPECIRDIFALFEWVADHAEEYKLDTNRIYLTGDSAGAHIAAVVAAIQSNDAVLAKMGIAKPRIKIAKTALFCGVYDYDKCVDQPGAAGLVKEMTGVEYRRYVFDYKFYRELSPINFVDASFPPTYMVSAPFDIFCGGQTEILEAELDMAGVYHKTYTPQDRLATHCFHLNLEREDSLDAIEGAVRFFEDDSMLN